MSGVKREWMGGNFVQLHVGLLEALGGDYETAAVIWAVKFHGGVGSWEATQAEFMEATALTRHKLVRALKRARDEGYLASEQPKSFDRRLSWSVVYDDLPSAGNRSMDEPESGVSMSRKAASSPSYKNVRIEEGEFTEFWSLYPRKIRKADTRKAYEKARQKATQEQIVSGLRAHPIMREQRQEFIPHPPTWLNGERWNDALTVEPDEEEIRRRILDWCKYHPLTRSDGVEYGSPEDEAERAAWLERARHEVLREMANG